MSLSCPRSICHTVGMRSDSRRWLVLFFVALVTLNARLMAEQDSFRWMDFHSDADQPTVVWVERALAAEKWTAIREIGVEYDAALVIATLRPTPQSPANADRFSVYSVSLTTHQATLLLTGYNLRHLDYLRLMEYKPTEPAILYDNCTGCAADTYLTAFYYDQTQHGFGARWMRSGAAVPVWTATAPPGVTWTQVFAVMAEPNGVQYIATWNHMEYGKDKPAEDYLYRYDRDSWTGIERTALVSNKEAELLKQRLCRGETALPGLMHGQDSALCQQILKPERERKPSTSPANTRGRSTPPPARH